MRSALSGDSLKIVKKLRYTEGAGISATLEEFLVVCSGFLRRV